MVIAKHGFDLRAQPHERVACNQCGSDTHTRVATADRYGLPATTVQCDVCGLMFLNPRMTREAYATFYRKAYRDLVSALFWQHHTIESVQENSRKYAIDLVRHVSEIVEPFPRSTLLDVGGSTGIVARAWADRWGCVPTVVEPHAEELAHATGCTTVCASAEDVTFPARSFDVVLLCRTIEHLLDPKAVLTRARDWVTDRGFLVVDAMDVSRWGRGARFKVDHPYAFTAETFARMVRSAGWRIRGQWIRRRGQYVGLVCSPQE